MSETFSRNRAIREPNTLGGIFMAGFIVAGKNNGGDKYGGLADNPPHYPRHIFTQPNILFRNSKFIPDFQYLKLYNVDNTITNNLFFI